MIKRALMFGATLFLLSNILESGNCLAQSSTYQIIYVDNSNPSSLDQLSASQINSVNRVVDQLASEDGQFLIFGSNSKNPQLISGKTSLKDFERLVLSNTTRIPDHFADVHRLRESIFPNIDKWKPTTVQINFFATGAFMKDILTGISPLVKLLPQEIADLYGCKVIVKLHAPAIFSTEEMFKSRMSTELKMFENRNVQYEYYMED